jgi:hypothetical protein
MIKNIIIQKKLALIIIFCLSIVVAILSYWQVSQLFKISFYQPNYPPRIPKPDVISTLHEGKEVYKIITDAKKEVQITKIELDPLNVKLNEKQKIIVTLKKNSDKLGLEDIVSGKAILDKKEIDFQLKLKKIEGEKEGLIAIWEGEWERKFITKRKYQIEILAKSEIGEDKITLDLIPASCPNVPNGGDYTVNTNCSFSGEINGVDNGNLIIASGYTLTINAGQTIVFNPGKSVIVDGAIAIASTSARLKKTYLWVSDFDSDGSYRHYAQDSAPIYGAQVGTRRYNLGGYVNPQQDCMDWGTGAQYVYQYVSSLAPDRDLDGYYTSYLGTYCVGGGAWINGRLYYVGTTGNYEYVYQYHALGGNDCNDSNANIFQNISNLSPDADQDGYTSGAPSTQCVGNSTSVGGRTYYKDSNGAFTFLLDSQKLGTNDCNDTNANIFQNIASLVTDADQDGYTIGTAATQCVGTTSTINGRTYYRNSSGAFTWLASTASLGTDCNDSDNTRWRLRYADNDGDGYGAGSAVCVGNHSGYVDNSSDCNDSNANIFQNISNLSPDADQDGYTSGAASTQCVGNSTSVGGRTYYKDSNGAFTFLLDSQKLGTNDCNDTNANIFQNIASLVTDADQDGYTIGTAATQCVGTTSTINGRTYYRNSSGAFTWLASTASLGTDCNDSDNTRWRLRYADNDGDGYGAGSAVCVGNHSGYVDNSSDCNDSNANIFQNIASLVTDADQDGYTIGTAATQCVGTTSTINGRTYYRNSSGAFTWLASTASLGTDCNDSDNTRWRLRYADNDGDGYGAGSAVCVGNHSGYVDNSSDCNDSNANIFQNIASLVTDADQDGYTIGTAATQCVGTTSTINGRTYYRNSSGAFTWLASTASLGTDCNDSDNTRWRLRYADNDGDGYGAGSAVCVGNHSGYVDNSSDCCDTNANVNPGQTQYFTTAHSCSGVLPFDYNCNGQEEKQYTQLGDASSCVWYCNSSGVILGWATFHVPECGQTEIYFKSQCSMIDPPHCDITCDPICVGPTEFRTQACR